jgi:hypothetical protein
MNKRCASGRHRHAPSPTLHPPPPDGASGGHGCHILNGCWEKKLIARLTTTLLADSSRSGHGAECGLETRMVNSRPVKPTQTL